ncbi:MAG TPA: peptidase M24, partial [Humibacter sp.]|nr:peptidase M24 [Humibacter sp.]
MSDNAAPPARPQSDLAVKRARVLALLDEAGAASVLLTSTTAVAWYLDGGRQHVSLAADPIVALRVSHDGDEAFVTSNETARLVAEELPAGITVRERSWYEPPEVRQEPGSLLERDLDAQLRAARAVLLPGELARFRALGRDAAHAVTDVLLAAEPTWSERRTAAELAARLVSVGADPLVLLVAGES